MAETKVKDNSLGAVITAPDEADLSETVRAHVSHSERWERSFVRLKAYRRKFGNCEVPFRYSPDAGLGRWVAFQRTLYKRMREGNTESMSLTPDRIKRLEEIGFEWSVKRKTAHSWDAHYQQLVEFAKRFNHCQVPIGWKLNPMLATWVAVQHEQISLFHMGHDSQISQEQIAKLTDIGFVWDERTLEDGNDQATLRSRDFAQTPLYTEGGLSRVSSVGVLSNPSALDGVIASLSRPVHGHQATQPFTFLGTQAPFHQVPGIHLLQSAGTQESINSYQRVACAPTVESPGQSTLFRSDAASGMESVLNCLHASPFAVTLGGVFPATCITHHLLVPPQKLHILHERNTGYHERTTPTSVGLPNALAASRLNMTPSAATSSCHAILNDLLSGVARPPLPLAIDPFLMRPER